ncbi:MAG: hypothetical protein PHH84_05400 [Oscillospiraceae bacterium]|nr:hypothetical protein [Oscillospiraceae bacterium]MDD4414203.1 hypothetical protein [Oscillospiraceae bacterium]
MTGYIWITLIFIHLICCLLIFLLIKYDFLKISAQLFPLTLFVPIWGIAMLLSAEYLSRRSEDGTKEIQVDDLKLSEFDFRGIGLYMDDRQLSVVPLEEAIIVNDAKTRRDFMMDIIGQDADQYIDLLQKAKFNNDIEIIHYASTAIMEIQRAHELALQRSEAAVKSNPDDSMALDAYMITLKKYINSGLVEDNFLFIQRKRFHEAFLKRIEMPDAEQSSFFDAVDNLIEMSDFIQAEEVLQKSAEIWPENENTYRLKLKICHLSKDKEKKKELIKIMQNKRVQFSAETREAIDYWSR